MHIIVFFGNIILLFSDDFIILVLSSVGSLHLMSSSMNFLSILILNQLLTLSLGTMTMKSLSVLPLHCPKVHDYHVQAALVDVIVD
jgi:hypothetical protein